MTHVMPFAEVLDAADQLSQDEQQELIAILHRRLSQAIRQRAGAEIQEARQEFAEGSCVPASPDELKLLERITCDPKVMVGKPVIKGTRLTVDHVLNLMAHSATIDEILEEYQGLERDDIQACLLFASKSLSNTAFMPVVAEPA